MGVFIFLPVASDMMWGLTEPMSFVDELNDLPPELNEIDAQTYFYLSKTRKKAFDIVQDRSLPIYQRLINLLDFGVETQQDLEEYKEGTDPIPFFDVFS